MHPAHALYVLAAAPFGYFVHTKAIKDSRVILCTQNKPDSDRLLKMLCLIILPAFEFYFVFGHILFSTRMSVYYTFKIWYSTLFEEMWMTLGLATGMAVILGKLISACSLWRYKSFPKKLVHLAKFGMTYPVLAAMYRSRRMKKAERVSAENFAKNVVPFEDDWVKEMPHEVSGDEMDAVQFIAMDKQGNSMLLSLTQRQHQTEVWLALRYQGRVYTLPEHPTTVLRKYENERRVFVGKGMRFELREPCRKWRVWLSLTVRKGVSGSSFENEANLVHLKLNGWWASNSDLFDFAVSHEASLISNSLAGSAWTSDLYQLVTRLNPKITNQWGQLKGELKIGDGGNQIASEISMHCLKSRISTGQSWNALTKLNAYVALLDSGTYVLLGSLEVAGILKNFGFGYVHWPSGTYTPTTDSDAFFDHKQSGEFEPSFVPFSSDRKHFLLRTHEEASISLSLGADGETSSLRFIRFDLNGQNGYGFHLVSSSKAGPVGRVPDGRAVQLVPEYCYLSSEAALLVLPFSHRAAKASELTGGKGCNLAQLCQLQGQFTVPSGFCVTTAAYKAHVDSNPTLAQLIQKLEGYGSLSSNELQSTCLKIEKLFAESEISAELKLALENELNRCFYSTDWTQKKFAVRSSAVGEDSSDLSTAGQLETYLDRQGLDSICEALRLCWASQFRLPAVQYRKQHGQPLTHPVAVVVQEMIQPDVSGVLFTVDPVDGDPLKIVINANPGLGELVVSGAVTPDTITLDRSYFKENVTWSNVIFGSDQSIKCCLDKALAIKLGNIGILIEHALNGKPKDIEWAIRDGIIYVLQARDITSLETETEYDLMHEFDDAIRNEDDCYTTANVGEVLAEPQTPLSLSTQITAVDLCVSALRNSRNATSIITPHSRRMLHSHCNRTLFNILETFYSETGHMKDTRVPEICFMGHPLDRPEVKEAAVKRFRAPGLFTSIYRVLNMALNTLYFIPRLQERETERFDKFKLNSVSIKNHKELYKILEDGLSTLASAWSYHIANSTASSFGYNLVAAALLPRDPLQEYTADHYSDIATLFSSCQNIVSADVPSALKELARVIIKAEHASKFRELKPIDGIAWLNGPESGDAGAMFQEFLAKHGHRSFAEIDIGTTPWKSDPTSLIITLQAMLRDETAFLAKKEEVSVEEAIENLKNPLNYVQRQLLKIFVPVARTGVVRREHSKNLAIKVTDILRSGYLQLGTVLANQGYLPDRELIFYLTHIEIGDLIEYRPAKLVATAVRRRKLVPILKSFHYPEIIIGQPKPIEETAHETHFYSSSVVIKGTPVSQGVAKGPVRVARKLEDAKDTQPGEILIATSTDIGWSPYFPMLAGVATELGGLLSHGAVVAREYGLPCIVNAQNATRLFSTGDLARLDAGAGTLEKL